MPDTSENADRRGSSLSAKWLVVILLSVIATCLIVEVCVTIASAQSTAVGRARGDSVVVVAGQITQNEYGLYLIDLDSRTICVYKWLSGRRPLEGKLRLMAARNYTFDRKLDDYNTELPPREIRKLVGKARRLGEQPDDE